MQSQSIVHQVNMSAHEVLSLYAQGYQVVCRYCKVPFITRPEVLSAGEAPQFITCPRNQNHFSLLTEPAEQTQEMRHRMKARRNEP